MTLESSGRFDVLPDEEQRGLRGSTPQCINCHWRDSIDPRICKAFPGGIPKAILFNEFDHRKPFPGDNNIQFFPKDSLIPHPMRESDARPDS
jgi:hypothetical protein